MDTYKLIDLNEYVQTGEGGSSLTYTHKTRNALAKLFNPGAEAEMAEREFLTSRSVFDMGIPTPEPYQLITDGIMESFGDIQGESNLLFQVRVALMYS